MHIQEKKVIYIPRKQYPLNKRNTCADDNVRCFPVDNTHSTYGLVYNALYEIEQDTKKYNGYNQPNTVCNGKGPGIVFLNGIGDVDMVYQTYTRHPDWFKGSSLEALKNRETVYNLTYNLLSSDWYNLLSNYASTGKLGYNEFMAFADALKEIGIVRQPKDKPRYTLKQHSRRQDEFYTENQITHFELGSIIKYVPELHGNFDDIVFGEPNKINTANLIRHCIGFGGIGYLVELLKVLYGTRTIVGSDPYYLLLNKSKDY